MNRSIIYSLIILFTLAAVSQADEKNFLADAKCVVILGDSITYSGQYSNYVEAFWRLKNPDSTPRFINLGLPSETVSGLSEKGHAGGRFPRPDLHERLDRVLEQIKPDLIIACYGMNCGIYQPYSDERFQTFQKGIRALRAKAEKAGAKVVHVTPPSFDPNPIRNRVVTAKDAKQGKMYAGYNEVLDLYSAWLVAQRGNHWKVVDAHAAMNDFLKTQRKIDPSFHLAGDGVHINQTGHWIVAREILRAAGFDDEICEKESPAKGLAALWKNQKLTGNLEPAQLIHLIHQKQVALTRAWLTKTGHKRPGIPKGLSIERAEQHAAELQKQILEMLAK